MGNSREQILRKWATRCCESEEDSRVDAVEVRECTGAKGTGTTSAPSDTGAKVAWVIGTGNVGKVVGDVVGNGYG